MKDSSPTDFKSECCNAAFIAVITENGKWELKCGKCEETCGNLKEKFHIWEPTYLF